MNFLVGRGEPRLSSCYAAWTADRALLAAEGFVVRAVRERVGFVEAEVRAVRAHRP